MTTQLDLFSARASDPDTSHAAAQAWPGHRLTQRHRIFRHLQRQGPATSHEVEAVLGIPRHVAARRITDLVQLGLVMDSGERRLTDRGCQSIVWEPRSVKTVQQAKEQR